MDRPPEDIEPGDSLAETRMPAIFEVQRPSDVPKDSDAWRTMVLEDEEYVANAAALAAAAGRIERATATLRSRRPPAASLSLRLADGGRVTTRDATPSGSRRRGRYARNGRNHRGLIARREVHAQETPDLLDLLVGEEEGRGPAEVAGRPPVALLDLRV